MAVKNFTTSCATPATVKAPYHPFETSPHAANDCEPVPPTMVGLVTPSGAPRGLVWLGAMVMVLGSIAAFAWLVTVMLAWLLVFLVQTIW